MSAVPTGGASGYGASQITNASKSDEGADMDWKQFIASIVGSVAWPAVIFVLLFMLRGQLSGLVTRLEEFTLPGGTRAKFVRQLETARNQADQLPPPPGEVAGMPLRPPPKPDDAYLRLAQEFPEAAVIESFRELERSLQAIKGVFPGNSGEGAKDLVQRLLDLNFIDDKTYYLYMSLKSARNLASHAGPRSRVTPGEAIDFREQAKRLNEVFLRALEKLRSEAIVSQR